ncbi:MAG: hypothetical protein IJM50_01030 [Lachnospiraceae bacterium]|nr:hypothetical protein [Lachnospiraceae bacterium]
MDAGIVISIVALVFSLFTFIHERLNLHDQAYNLFSQYWLSLDGFFIDHPGLHKYFYPDKEGKYVAMEEDDPDRELALCVAEEFMDVFQYAETYKRYLKKEDRNSYEKYRISVMNSPLMKEARGVLEISSPAWKDKEAESEDPGTEEDKTNGN